MPHILKNDKLELRIDDPEEHYRGSRFDWTGKIAAVKFKGVPVSTGERPEAQQGEDSGQGFYNEFGIDGALGFDEAAIGGWFHKIGVGLLRKDDAQYDFHKRYQIRPATFVVTGESKQVTITCQSETLHGYSYTLRKIVALEESGFIITYHLHNTGETAIQTTEYVHNFLAIAADPVGSHYRLRFPFSLRPDQFGETVNPDNLVCMGKQDVGFIGMPKEPFFFSNVSGGEKVNAMWELTNRDKGIGIRETASFSTNSVNVWGWQHVISPELFHRIFLQAGESTEWSRKYEIF